eukprot:2827945-Lingulodinium_polyedra.AAC.1
MHDMRVLVLDSLVQRTSRIPPTHATRATRAPINVICEQRLATCTLAHLTRAPISLARAWNARTCDLQTAVAT